MIKSTVNSQKALLSRFRISSMMILLIIFVAFIPQKTKAQCPTNVAYSSGGAGTFTFSGTFPNSSIPTILRVTISAGTGIGNTVDLTVQGSPTTTTIVTNVNGLDATSVASSIEYINAGGSIWSTCSTSKPLPVTLLSFTGIPQGLVNVLTWKTATEINNDKFVIKRSNGTGEFVEIGTVQGSGNTNEIKEYSFIDNNPLPGSNIYKLIQVDFNGIFESFKPIIIKSNNEGVKFTVNPNPSNGIFSIRIDEGFQNNPLEITDPTGRVIYKSTTSNVDVDISNLSPGIYTINSNGNLPTKITIW